MKTLQWSDAASAEELLRQAQDEEVVVIRDGRPVAVVQPLDEEELAWLMRERDPGFVASIAQARADIEAGKGVDHDALKKELGL